MGIKTILLVTHAKFWLENRGGLVRTAHLYRFLETQEFSVPIFFVGQLTEKDREIIRSNYQTLEILAIGNAYTPQKRETPRKTNIKDIKKLFARKILKYHKPSWLLRYVEPKIQDFKSQAHVEFFKEICLDVQPDYIFVESIRLAYLIQESRCKLPPNTLTVIDNMDVMHQRCKMFHDFGEKHWVNITEQEETQILNLFDVIMAIQSKDAAAFRKMLPGKKIITVYHATEITAHQLNHVLPVRLAYIGTKSPHNRHAIGNFLKTTWPMLHARFNNQVVLNIIGSVCDSLNTPSLPEGVHLIGFTEDLKTVYRDSDIVINPVYFGGGLKIKNVEALCNSKALVTTTVGAEGLEHGIDEAFVVCDAPEATFRKLTQLIRDPSLRQSLSRKALAFAQQNFTDEFAYSELSQLLNVGVNTVNHL